MEQTCAQVLVCSFEFSTVGIRPVLHRVRKYRVELLCPLFARKGQLGWCGAFPPRGAGGTAAQVARLRAPSNAADDPFFTALERDVIRLSIAMTQQVRVDDSLLASLRAQLPTVQALVELIGTIAAYNMVFRVLVAAGVTPE
jgi:hypothetical protein